MADAVESSLIRTRPETQGIASAVILEFIEALERSQQEIHSFMLLKNGYVVAEGWWSPHAPNIPHMMFSLSKSFTATAVGIAVGEGYFTVDDPVIAFFPDSSPDHASEPLAAMQIKHLLSMSTGHDVKTFPFMYGREDGNWAKGFFETPVIHKPGTHFLYNTGATYMLSEIIQRTTGEKLLDFLTPRLFGPLGIKNPTWLEAPHGVNLGGVGLSITTEDIARFGQLYLQRGLWQGQQILSEHWVEEATSAQISNGSDPHNDWSQGYGYQFWRCQHGFYRGDGAFGQFCIVMQDHNVVLAMTSAASDMQQVLNAVWNTLLPGLQTEVSIGDAETNDALVAKVSNLGFEPVAGNATSSMAKHVSGKTYVAEPNKLGVEYFTLDFTSSGCILRVKTGHGHETISAGHGKWQKGSTGLFDEIWLTDSQPFIASGSWLKDDCYCMVVRLYETPYIYNLTYQFKDDTVTLMLQINVSLDSTEPYRIEAKQSKMTSD